MSNTICRGWTCGNYVFTPYYITMSLEAITFHSFMDTHVKAKLYSIGKYFISMDFYLLNGSVERGERRWVNN